MPIAKTAQRPDHLRRPFILFPSARAGFKALLKELQFAPDESVLLPAYIGWSPREGSGVFDPISELGLNYAFYPVDERLQIDLPGLQAALAGERVKVLVLIHYFGRVDPNYPAAVELARESGAWILEDEAHAMITDLVGGLSGRLGDAALFSLHKMLPMPAGGMLLVDPGRTELFNAIEPPREALPGISPPWQYDLARIAARRRENARRLTELLRPLAGEVDPLWGDPHEGEVPQTYPVLVRNASRDRLYESMNDAGYGVVSLYHTMIRQIAPESFPQSHWLSLRVLNLPVHQDIEVGELEEMVACLGERLET